MQMARLVSIELHFVVPVLRITDREDNPPHSNGHRHKHSERSLVSSDRSLDTLSRKNIMEGNRVMYHDDVLAGILSAAQEA